MKKRAIIYTRVSTDEQNNGYSPADQKDKLYKYFIKWDRFSRNVAEAYITIRDLKKLGVEPQSIEQPLDFEIPESKIMLAIYLAAPEVDNDRRSLNVFHGMRRGKIEGRWLGSCPKGYINTRDENNKPIILPEGGKKEELVKRAFAEYATGLYNIEELRKKLNKEGFSSTRNSFWRFLRNKAYIGKVLVTAFKNEPAHWVEGIHLLMRFRIYSKAERRKYPVNTKL